MFSTLCNTARVNNFMPVTTRGKICSAVIPTRGDVIKQAGDDSFYGESKDFREC